MLMNKTLEELLACIAVILSLFYLIWAVNKSINKGYDSQSQACETYFGKNYMFINGDRSPDLCVSKDGDIKYFEAIPVLE